MIAKLLFWISISLFILHEMDAVKTREWRMLFLINRLNDKTGHIFFTSLHFVLFIIIFYLMDYYFKEMFVLVSILFIMHWIMHLIFRNHSENRMNNLFSRILISLMFINSILSLFYYFILR